MKAISFFALGAAALVSGCASRPSTPYVTPQVTIQGNRAEDVRMQLMQRCVSGGATISESTTHQVVCSKQFDGSFGSIMFQALATPRYSTTPEIKIRYNLVPASTSTYVTLDMFIEYQTAFGQVNRMPYQNGDVARQAQTMLNDIKASLESAEPVASAAAPQVDSRAPAIAPPATVQPAPPASYERDPSKRCDACARIGKP